MVYSTEPAVPGISPAGTAAGGTGAAGPADTRTQASLLLAATVRALAAGEPVPLEAPPGVELSDAVVDEVLAVMLTALRSASPEAEGKLRRQLFKAGIYAPPCLDPAAAAPGPAAGEPVVEEGFHAVHPEVGGWNMERWLLAVPGEGDHDLGQFAASGLQEHLDNSLDAGRELLDLLREGTVTVHFFQQTGLDGDTGVECFQGVLYSPAAGWVATARPEPEDDDEVPDSRVWTAPALGGLVEAAGDHLAGLRPGAADEFGCRWVSGYLRDALFAGGIGPA